MRKDLFAHINTFSFQEIDRIGTSTLVNRMTQRYQSGTKWLEYVFAPILRLSFCLYLGAMIMAFSVNVKGGFDLCGCYSGFNDRCVCDFVDNNASI